MPAITVPRSLPRLSESVADTLARWIDEQGMVAGTQLPTEKALCERFEVSRAVIREAISRLKADGLVRTRQGAGAFVAAKPQFASFRLVDGGRAFALSHANFANPANKPNQASLSHLQAVLELRFVVETGAAALAALRRNAADLQKMRQALRNMDAALAAEANAVADDDAFHVAVAAASHNPQLEHFQAFMGQQLSESRLPTWSATGHATGRAQAAQREHALIYAAIEAEDVAGARRAAANHLIAAAGRLGLSSLPWKINKETGEIDE